MRLGRIDEVDAGHPIEQLLEHHLQLEAGQRVAQTEVRAEPERHVFVRRAGDVEPERIGEVLGIAVRRRIQQQHLLAGADLLAPQLDVSRVAVRAMFLMGDTQRSISSTADGNNERSASSASHCSRCVISWYRPPVITWRVVSSPPMRIKQRLVHQRVVVEAVTVDFGVDEDAREVVARRSPAIRDHARHVLRVALEGLRSST